MFSTIPQAIEFIFRSKNRLKDEPRTYDEFARDITPTRNLLLATRLLDTPREYIVVTGSKGKGSISALTANVLKSLGHTVGLLTSPHLVYWTERIRVNGEAISEADFLRILSELAPAIEAETARLSPRSYLSPQGIFLLVALRYFNERGVTVGVMEVGRGGRYDDVSLVPNKVSLFGPIFLEHTRYLGETVDRIAWHKAGIIKPASYAYSVAQEPAVLDVLQREADSKDAEFFWFSTLDKGEFIRETPDGILCRISRYGEIHLPFYGRYMIENAALAIQAAGNVHARLGGIPHQSAEYVQRVVAGLESARWYGRLQKLQDSPPVFVDGAVNPLSVASMLASLKSRLVSPVIGVLGVPEDRDMATVYKLMSAECDMLILTENHINPNIHFPVPEAALELARRYHQNVHYAPDLSAAMALAKQHAWPNSTILLAVAQPLVGEAMLLWGIDPRNL
ncbi:MAG: Mur ligase family protein [Anaerolineae bacterium]